ncbi:MAG: glycosyltransferase family 4 protein [Gammaproteobacteria bacterium]|nr:glycosyltransferase family 4 protein [Gammaproteobacteria bacterium]
MKLHILFPIKNEPSGGGNQFLAALRAQLYRQDVYVDNPEKADVLLFNSFPFGSAASLYKQVSRLKNNKGNKIAIIHRVDGPISVVRGNLRDSAVDRSIALFNEKIADATIYQSCWSRDVCLAYGIGSSNTATVISNAPDPGHFYPILDKVESCSPLIKIAISSWSSNWRKGFDVYRYIDRHLDFDRYEVTFVGNSPINFSNIRMVPPLPSAELGDLLRQQDMYLTASVDDPCSNAVMEALNCGLPVIARNSGGHPEIIGKGGVLFEGQSDVLTAINRCSDNLEQYRVNIHPTKIEEIGDRYVKFARKVWEEKQAPMSAISAIDMTDRYSLLSTVVFQRYASAVTRRICSTLPLREDKFYRNSDFFRKATWEPALTLPWTEPLARDWLYGVLQRLPLFLDSMRHARDSRLYRFSLSGDLQSEPGLVSSVFAAKIRYMAGLIDVEDREALSLHIKSFQRPDGAITDPWLARNNKWGRLKMAFLSRNVNNLRSLEIVRAESRQSFAALHGLGSRPDRSFDDIPLNQNDAEQYVLRLDWSKPWGAASHISHLVFFLHYNSLWFDVRSQWTITELLAFVESKFRQKDGAWYLGGAIVSPSERVNGAMKMITALDSVGFELAANPEGLIDLCLGVVNDGHACNHFNVICVLHHCQRLTDYRKAEIRRYCLDRLRRYRGHYWPWQGGFSFFSTGANDSYYNARVSTGMAEPDLHGTVLILWGIVLIVDILGWNEMFELQRPIT